MSGTCITAVLFDFGGVILSSPFEAFAHHEREHGLPEGFIRRLNATNPDANAWALLERSEVDLDGFAELFEAEAATAGHRIDARAILGLLGGEVRPEMVEALRRIRAAGLPLALLTNNFVSGPGGATAGSRPDIAEALALFDHVIESSVAGVRKPDPAAYDLVLDRLDVPAHEVVFLDDLGVNLKPARALGMTTIKVLDADQALTELEAVLGFPLR
ncbi:MAG TPA: HAD-IA family hydrolase [Acidimicrobiales bacterium]|nr:HAD-IA family hydrolase [Acidimicrobiales bacterium]